MREMTIVAATDVADPSQNVSMLLLYARMCENIHISQLFCFVLTMDSRRLLRTQNAAGRDISCQLVLPIAAYCYRSLLLIAADDCGSPIADC
jgi:hypothetical protein